MLGFCSICKYITIFPQLKKLTVSEFSSSRHDWQRVGLGKLSSKRHFRDNRNTPGNHRKFGSHYCNDNYIWVLERELTIIGSVSQPILDVSYRIISASVVSGKTRYYVHHCRFSSCSQVALHRMIKGQ